MTKLRKNMPSGEEWYISKYDEQQVTSFSAKVVELFKSASKKGYTELYFTIESTMEPYEDWPGDARLEVYGTRPMTLEELKDEELQRKLNDFAKEKGITPYEAGILMKLQKEGKV